MTVAVEPRTPIVVGVGTAIDDLEAVELMALAAERAGSDARCPSLLAAAQRVMVPRGTWSYSDPARIVAERIGARAAATWLVDLGIPQQTLLNEAMVAILTGEADVVVVVGGEAKARSARLAKASTSADAAGIAAMMRREGTADEIDQGGAAPDVHQVPGSEIVAEAEIEAGLWAPVEQYALIESALRAHDGASVDGHRREVAELVSRMSVVAASNPDAAFPAPRSVEDLMALDAANRPLAFPYGRWHASQWTVDQAAAVVVCSAAAAEAHGVPRDRWVFPLVGLDSSFAVALTKRRHLHRWPAMGVLGAAAEARLGRPLVECDHVEVYSCFPAAVRVQQRELGLPVAGTPTITGGMVFGGGPFNSFVLQATAAMVRRLREQPGLGLVTTVSGMLTKPGLAVWSNAPDGSPPLVADLHADAAEATEMVDVMSGYIGPARVAAVTVTYDGVEPGQVLAVVDTPTGARAIARTADPDAVDAATTTELVGQPVTLAGALLHL